MKKIKFIDLFSGLGGFRIGFEQACKSMGYKPICLFSSEIKKHAISTYKQNFKNDMMIGDIKSIDLKKVDNFDVLLAGFPCQSFSSAGVRRGFLDTRGTLFFEIEKILKAKKPKAFILENVEGLVKHDLRNKKDKIGNTLNTILQVLKKLGYKTNWRLLNAKDFGLAQERNRIFIIGSLKKDVDLQGFKKKNSCFEKIMEKNISAPQSDFFKLLLKKFKPRDLYGKSIKDKRGGEDNIHSWDLETKGKTNRFQKKLLNQLLKERRKKKWAINKKIDWMDGQALNLEEIYSLYNQGDLFSEKITKQYLSNQLMDLVKKGYLAYEHPKKRIKKKLDNGSVYTRVEDKNLKKGFNIVVGKLSFEISKIVDPKGITPTLLATDMDRVAIIDNGKIRKITITECKRLFGFSDNYKIELDSIRKVYNLFGESIAIPVVKEVSKRVLKSI